MTTSIDTARIEELIRQKRQFGAELSEANVAESFVAPLFAALGWDTVNPRVWNRQSYVRNAGFADAALQIQDRPVLFVEVKRLGRVANPQEGIAVQQALFGDDPVLSQAERSRQAIDRTPEEKQAMRYARAAGIRWAVLTNFERLILFDADEERVVLAFDAAEEYLACLDDLAQLLPANTPEEFDSRLRWYAGLQKKPEIDRDFYRFLSDWRLRLAQTIYDHNRGPESPLRGADGALDLDRLRQAVQRTLDRLIILRYADDVGFLDQHDLLEGQLEAFLRRRVYAVEYEFQDDINRLYRAFYRRHDTTIFAPDHVCERARIPNDVLLDLARDVSGVSFRKFSSDILGNTYESYLGQRLVLDGERVHAESDAALRKGGGIYYTPSYIVRYIVDHTLGRWLYGTANGRADGEPLPDAPPKRLADLAGLRVLDPAMGSGSFLIYAFDVLADFYERENERIQRENTARWDAWGQRALKEGMFGQDNDQPQSESTVGDSVARILQEHLYGVDLDPEAVEIAGVNLILRAFDRLRRDRERRKLPLILGQNLKVGNSLISGVRGADDLAALVEERRRLVALRGELRRLVDDEGRAAKLAEIEAAAAPLNAALNESLSGYFADVPARRPFNWEIEFPEAFDPDRPAEEQGLTVVVGNPPYVRIQARQWEEGEKRYLHERYASSNRNYDIYVLFVERGGELLAHYGYLGYIVPNKFFRLAYGENLRRLLTQGKLLSAIVDLGDNQVFPEQTTYTCLLFLRREEQDEFLYYEVDSLSQVPKALPVILDELESASAVRHNWFSVSGFGAEPWVFAFGAENELLRKMNQQGKPLQALTANIMQGLITSADDIFILEQVGKTTGNLVRVRSKAAGREYDFEPDLLKPLVSGEDVGRYSFVPTNKLLLFPYGVDESGATLLSVDRVRQLPRTWAYLKEYEEQLRQREQGRFDHEQWYMFGRQQNLERQSFSKICVAQTVKRLEMALDMEGAFYLHNVRVNGIVLQNSSREHYLYVLALLNSALLDFVFKSGSVRHRGGHYAANRQFIENLPIRALDLTDPIEKAAHDALVALAQRMLDLNRVCQAVDTAFAAALRGYRRTSAPLARLLGELHVARRALLDANEEGEVSAIAVDEQGGGLLLRALVASGGVPPRWRDVAQLDVPDEDLRLYLLLSLRAFLDENRRKRVWSRGSILNGLFDALQAPRLDSATPQAHQAQVAQLLAEARRTLPAGLPHHDVGLDRSGAPLHLSEVETVLAATDAEIDRRVEDLYGLSKEERRIVHGGVQAADS